MDVDTGLAQGRGVVLAKEAVTRSLMTRDGSVPSISACSYTRSHHACGARMLRAGEGMAPIGPDFPNECKDARAFPGNPPLRTVVDGGCSWSWAVECGSAARGCARLGAVCPTVCMCV